MSNAGMIKKIRREILVNLKMVYPASLQGQDLFTTLLNIFPDYEWAIFRQDLAYLIEKGYVERTMPTSGGDANLVPWKKRWFDLTASGVEIADQVRHDEALEV